MNFFFVIVILVLSLNVYGVSVGSCASRPPENKELSVLFAAVENQVVITEGFEIDGAEFCNFKEESHSYVFYISQKNEEKYSESLRVHCINNRKEEGWKCESPVVLKYIQSGEIKIPLYGAIDSAEAIDVLTFMKSLSKDNLSQLKGLQFYQIIQDDIEKSRQVSSIASYNEMREYKVSTQSTEFGNTFILKRIQCGLVVCSLEVKDVFFEVY